MIKLHMKSSKTWKTCMSAISGLVEEATFRIEPDGIRLKAMDPSHVVLVDFDLPATAFDGYDVTKTTIGVNLTEMNRIMARAKAEDELTLELDEEKNRLVLTFAGASTRRLSIPVIDVRDEELPEPKLQFTATVDVVAGVIQDGLKDAEIVGDNAKFEADENGLRISAESDKGATELKLGKDNKALIKHDVRQPIRAAYSVKCLSNIIKAAAPTDVVQINLGTDLPIQLDFPIANGKLRFLLAPRVEAD